METSPYLKCPFCGNDNVEFYKWVQSECWSISCGNQDCPMNSCLENRFKSKDDAVYFWNHRYGIKYSGAFDRRED